MNLALLFWELLWLGKQISLHKVLREFFKLPLSQKGTRHVARLMKI
jgi:hypothetical protein